MCIIKHTRTHMCTHSWLVATDSKRCAELKNRETRWIESLPSSPLYNTPVPFDRSDRDAFFCPDTWDTWLIEMRLVISVDVTWRRWPLFFHSPRWKNKTREAQKRWTATLWRSHILVGRSFRELKRVEKPCRHSDTRTSHCQTVTTHNPQ